MKNLFTPASALFGAAALAVTPAVMAIGIGLSATYPANACSTRSGFVVPYNSSVVGTDNVGRSVYIQC